MRNYKISLRTKARRMGFDVTKFQGVLILKRWNKKIYSGSKEDIDAYLNKYAKIMNQYIQLPL